TTARKPTLHACVIVPVQLQIEDAPDEAQVNRLSGTVGADDQATATPSKCEPGCAERRMPTIAAPQLHFPRKNPPASNSRCRRAPIIKGSCIQPNLAAGSSMRPSASSLFSGLM